MKHLKFLVGLLAIFMLVIASGAAMAQTIRVQPTAQPTRVVETAVVELQVQPTATTPPARVVEPAVVELQVQPTAIAPPTRVVEPAVVEFQVQPTATAPPRRGAENLVVIPPAPPTLVPAAPQCYDNDGDGTTDDCWCASNDGECLVELVANCNASNGDELNPGPENTACWKGDGTPVPPPPPSSNNGSTFQRGFDDLAISTPGPGVIALNCTDGDEDGDTDACWCESNNGECLVDLVAWCQGEGDILVGGTETTTCWATANHDN